MRLLIRKFKLQISYFKIKILLPKQTCNKIVFSCQTTMMLNLFKENVRIAAGSIRTQILRTSLTVLIIAIELLPWWVF
jgi:hypothetical protein